MDRFKSIWNTSFEIPSKCGSKQVVPRLLFEGKRYNEFSVDTVMSACNNGQKEPKLPARNPRFRHLSKVRR